MNVVNGNVVFVLYIYIYVCVCVCGYRALCEYILIYSGFMQIYTFCTLMLLVVHQEWHSCCIK